MFAINKNQNFGKLLIFAIILNKSAHAFFGSNTIKKIPEEFWGPQNLKSLPQDSKIYPFEIKIDQQILNDLQLKLNIEINSTQRFKPPLDSLSGFEYGMNAKFLQKIIKYWQTTYNWREREKLMNQFPNFKTKISGLDIHFQHVKSLNGSRYKETKPLLVLHGWPGSFLEFEGIIPLLTDPVDSEFNFEVINPSLPGYGFSDPPQRPGLGPADMVPIFLKLMQRLGHQKFYIHAEDFGSIISTHMATVYPQHVIALHSNMCQSTHPMAFVRLFVASLFPSFFMTPAESAKYLPLSNYLTFIIRETGHFHIHATKPDTIGLVLSMTPTGLAAYILEKFVTWTNIDWVKREDGGGILEAFSNGREVVSRQPGLQLRVGEVVSQSIDHLLDNIMIYWVTNSVTTSVRLYLEVLGDRESSYGLNNIPVQIPVGCLVGGKDPYAIQSRWVLQDKFPNLVSYKITEIGGHFLALEQPKLVAHDFFEFVQKLSEIK